MMVGYLMSSLWHITAECDGKKFWRSVCI